jgi:hypothetical protein
MYINQFQVSTILNYLIKISNGDKIEIFAIYNDNDSAMKCVDTVTVTAFQLDTGSRYVESRNMLKTIKIMLIFVDRVSLKSVVGIIQIHFNIYVSTYSNYFNVFQPYFVRKYVTKYFNAV